VNERYGLWLLKNSFRGDFSLSLPATGYEGVSVCLNEKDSLLALYNNKVEVHRSLMVHEDDRPTKAAVIDLVGPGDRLSRQNRTVEADCGIAVHGSVAV
jgi:hypothetical protein